MKHVIIHTLKDTLNLLPFLFVAFLVMEFIEHKFSKQNKNKLTKAGKFGPLVGSLLGAVPQCGFSVMATNLYATRIISIGTLFSIYLSTSDEMLPILISRGANISEIIKILIIKIVIGMICGFIIDLIIRRKSKNNKKDYEIKDFCLEEHCDCEHSLIKSSIKHTINIFIFIVIATFVLNLFIHYLGEENVSKLFLKDTLLSPFISSLIGLIPNCASSVIITELYLSEVISLSSCIAGLLTGSGVALLVLFRVNNNTKQNIKIIITLYLISALSGVLMHFIQLVF